MVILWRLVWPEKGNKELELDTAKEVGEIEEELDEEPEDALEFVSEG
jgi:hypothetical protein